MPEAQIQNPDGAFGFTDTLTLNPRRIDFFVASGAVSEGDVVVMDAALTAAGDVQAATADVSADDPATVLGVAIEDAADGAHVGVVTYGAAVVNISTATVAFGELATFHATVDGAADGITADATTVTGDHFGVFQSANDVPDTDKAIVWVRQV